MSLFLCSATWVAAATWSFAYWWSCCQTNPGNAANSNQSNSCLCFDFPPGWYRGCGHPGNETPRNRSLGAKNKGSSACVTSATTPERWSLFNLSRINSWDVQKLRKFMALQTLCRNVERSYAQLPTVKPCSCVLFFWNHLPISCTWDWSNRPRSQKLETTNYCFLWLVV